MKTKLPDELRLVLEQDGATPVHVVDAATNTCYVILRARPVREGKGRLRSATIRTSMPARRIHLSMRLDARG